ncbi:phosphoribosylaminoimidazolesuccinocarboxamide synthase [Peribacillus cavernae]|uniref:Phosphoribosylaminoimidazole-succinocarboxamide synthase n=1 Tax=Peribacillus cavernae TaxID=1674310 RepID=A0A3S0TXY3_9BACI|nr:phosphoribosylaminoimidazolesuccinocarboxamide synthase [Peribacillus cavernae]MDQ0219846.1 phosphoribosylaminoimidazole-succinocarboxamide synthase [Peribacillus cavernae]RUQ27237.1 phosphoribosylaminoimidazolesuccinocarboxamide synthase [Peribacillus cavernae]
MKKGELLYEGKAKRIYATDENGLVWVEYKDSATAFNGVKKAEITGKGMLNNKISSLLFSKLHQENIASHFVEQLSDTEQLVKKVDIIPLEVVVRNTVAGTLSKRLGIPEGTPLKKTLVELYYKDDALGDPLLTEDHIEELALADKEEVEMLKQKALQINRILIPFFKELGVSLIDFKLEFGKTEDNEILLADEISPDTCRLWDIATNERLDKDVFRRDLGNLTDAYEKILTKLGENLHV